MKSALKKTIGLVVTVSFLWSAPLASAWAADTNLAGQTSGILLSTPTVTNGNPLLVQIDTRKLSPPITTLGLIFQDREFPVYRHPVNPAQDRFGLIGIPYRQAPGPAKLALEWTNATGEHVQTIPFEIITGKFRTDVLKVDSARVNPSKKNIKRTQKEARRVGKIYAAGSLARLWNGAFQQIGRASCRERV